MVCMDYVFWEVQRGTEREIGCNDGSISVSVFQQKRYGRYMDGIYYINIII